MPTPADETRACHAVCQRDPDLALMASAAPLMTGKPTAVAIAILPSSTSKQYLDGQEMKPAAVWLSRDQAIVLRDFIDEQIHSCCEHHATSTPDDRMPCFQPSGDVGHDCPTEQAGRDGSNEWVCACGSIWTYGVSKRGNGTWRLATNDHGGYEGRWVFASFDPSTRRSLRSVPNNKDVNYGANPHD